MQRRKPSSCSTSGHRLYWPRLALCTVLLSLAGCASLPAPDSYAKPVSHTIRGPRDFASKYCKNRRRPRHPWSAGGY
jgi:hypothetical protein